MTALDGCQSRGVTEPQRDRRSLQSLCESIVTDRRGRRSLPRLCKSFLHRHCPQDKQGKCRFDRVMLALARSGRYFHWKAQRAEAVGTSHPFPKVFGVPAYEVRYLSFKKVLGGVRGNALQKSFLAGAGLSPAKRAWDIVPQTYPWQVRGKALWTYP